MRWGCREWDIGVSRVRDEGKEIEMGQWRMVYGV